MTFLSIFIISQDFLVRLFTDFPPKPHSLPEQALIIVIYGSCRPYLDNPSFWNSSSPCTYPVLPDQIRMGMDRWEKTESGTNRPGRQQQATTKRVTKTRDLDALNAFTWTV